MRPVPSVLVIDDHPDALETIGQILIAVGVKRVCQVDSAEKALRVLNTEDFNLIIADYRLAGMDGVEFLEKLRAGGDRTPLLLISGAPDKAGVIRAASQPNVDFFGKPFRLAELLGAMDRLCA